MVHSDVFVLSEIFVKIVKVVLKTERLTLQLPPIRNAVSGGIFVDLFWVLPTTKHGGQ